jgi:hypothetical protein
MRFLRVFGKFLISVGIGIILFVVWTLWGTGIYTAREQDRLGAEFDLAPRVTLVPGDSGGPIRVPESYQPGPGEPAFRLRIPKLDKSYVVVEGVGTEDLKKGPGHYPSCRPEFGRPLCTEFEEIWPGEEGRVIVSRVIAPRTASRSSTSTSCGPATS